MGKKVEVSISPYIPLSPDPSSERPVNGYFEIRIRYGREGTGQREGEDAYKTPTVTVSGFVKEEGDTTAIFNTSDEFAAFVRTLQFDDTKMYEDWIVEKADERNLLQIKKKTGTPLKEDFVCSFHSLRFNPTNLKGDDARAVLEVKAEGFGQGEADVYEISARKIYVADILSFREETGSNIKKIGEEFTLLWSGRGDFVQSARLQEGSGEPKDVDISGNRTFCCGRPTVYKLTVENLNPGARFSAASYVEIEVSKPVITSFTANKTYAYAGEEVVLSWEADSVYGCQINGEGTMYDAKGSITVFPGFTDGESTRDIKYRLCAYGYQGKDPLQVYQEVVIHRTLWEKLEGELQGIDLAGMKEGRTEGVFFDGETYYVFDGKQLLASKDGLSYGKLSELSPEKGYTLNENYKCGFYKGRFYLAGLQSGEDICIASYEVKSGAWDMVFGSGNGEKFLNGCFCPDVCHGRLYYVFFSGKSVYIYEELEEGYGWNWTGRAAFGGDIVAVSGCCRENRLYLSLLFESRKMENCSIEIGGKGGPGELVKESVILEGERNFNLMQTDNQILILGEEAVYDAVSGKKLDIGRGGKILAGMDTSPFVICREDGGYSRYRLHMEENKRRI